ncbi:hypothetical protein M975_1925 [Buttiauxella brennerae ATCC 51605]|uniref:Uncharacterized protein n=1 Tax=Buttiauxella brennerae ATCC 51605 TaxID=1354251 RepID=A0A1B7IQL3_9ENTR|nr:hypothetical protein [Buttiauxella brennerae]OAT32033.1 hypothetical protein M975_1925 [Buttiauxella brennerae ATCC 51605]
MQQFAIAGAASVRPFDAFKSIQHHPSHRLTSASFTPPPKKSWLDKLVDILRQEARP